jgi:hypothetical protein
MVGKYSAITLQNRHGRRDLREIGLAADVKILEGDSLREYIKTYDKKYIQKI